MINYSDPAILAQIGEFVQQTRLQQNKTQQEVAIAAGVNRTTIGQLENGTGATLTTLIQVLRVLNQLHVFESFLVQKKISPLLIAEAQMKYRKRARHKKDTSSSQTPDW